MPMDKISTPVSFSFPKSKIEAGPKPETLVKLRQFARVYAHVRSLGEIGDIVLN